MNPWGGYLLGSLVLLAGCSDSPEDVEDAQIHESVPVPEPAPAVVHLVDRWQDVVRVAGPLAHLEIPGPVRLARGGSTGGTDGGELFALPWPAVTGSVSLRSNQGVASRAHRRAALEDGGFVWIPGTRRIEAEDLHLEVHDRRRLVTEYQVLQAGDQLEFPVDLLGDETVLRVRLRSLVHEGCTLSCTIGEAEPWEAVVEAKDWVDLETSLAGNPQTQTVRVQALSDRVDKALVMIDWFEIRSSAHDRLWLPAPLAGEDLVIEYLPRAPMASETLRPVSEPGSDRAVTSVLLLGTAAAISHPSSLPTLRLGRDPGVSLGPELQATTGLQACVVNAEKAIEAGAPRFVGLQPLVLEDYREELNLHQHAAELLPYLLDPELRLDDDLSVIEASTHGLAPGLSGKLLRRLEVSDDRRPALFLPTPSSIAFDMDTTTGERLRFAVGCPVLGEQAARPDTSVEFRARWVGEDGTSVELARVEVHRDQDGWFEQQVLVEDSWAGRGTLSFETSSSTAGHTPAAVADPRIVAPEQPSIDEGADEGPARPNVVLYLIDTLRADRLSCMGAKNRTTPTLDRLARDGYLFEHCYSVASWTRPSTASALTGLYPSYHGAIDYRRRLSRSVISLPEVLRAEGFSTWGFVSNSQVAAKGLSFEQGYHRFVGPFGLVGANQGNPQPGRVEPTSKQINDTFLPWLEQSEGEIFFAYLHSLDPHFPWTPPSRYQGRFDPDYQGPYQAEAVRASGSLSELSREHGLTDRDIEHLRSLYDEEILYQDHQIRRLVNALEAQGVLQDTILVFFSDHGEEFREHGQWGHGQRMWQELLRVPLIVWIPERWRGDLPPPPVRVRPRVSLIDLVPGLLEILGLVDPELEFQGQSFVSAIRGTAERSRTLLGEDDRRMGSVLSGSWKLIWSESPGGSNHYGLFDLRADPAEQVNQAEQRPGMVKRLLEHRREYDAQQQSRGFELRREGDRVDLDARTRQHLEDLGYVIDDGQ